MCDFSTADISHRIFYNVYHIKVPSFASTFTHYFDFCAFFAQYVASHIVNSALDALSKKYLLLSAAYANIFRRPSGQVITQDALVAQLDRVTGYEPVGRGFESLRAHHRHRL